jgi:hypothetical protein
LGISLEYRNEDSTVSLGHLQKFLFKQAAVISPVEELIALFDKQKQLPIGVLREFSKESLRNTNETIEKALTSFSLRKEDLFTVLFLHSQKKPTQVSSRLYFNPALVMYEYSLVGQLPMVSKQGLVLFSENTFASLIRHWPSILAFMALDDSFEKKIFFLEDQQCLNLDLPDPKKALSKLIKICLQAKRLPLVNIEAILNDTPKKIEKIIADACNDQSYSDNPYVKWLSSRSKIDAQSQMSIWKESLKDAFSFLIEQELTV